MKVKCQIMVNKIRVLQSVKLWYTCLQCKSVYVLKSSSVRTKHNSFYSTKSYNLTFAPLMTKRYHSVGHYGIRRGIFDSKPPKAKRLHFMEYYLLFRFVQLVNCLWDTLTQTLSVSALRYWEGRGLCDGGILTTPRCLSRYREK